MIMKHLFTLALCFLCLQAASLRAVAAVDGSGLTPVEKQREIALHDRLCANKTLDCSFVDSVFADSRLTVLPIPEPAPPPQPSAPNSTHERNPYLTDRFGLLTSVSVDRCRAFVAAHALAFDAAYKFYGVPAEIICGHLRLETNFGIATGLSPHPFGTIPAVTRLVSLYVHRPANYLTSQSFAQRQNFAANQLALLLAAAVTNGWDVFSVPGSPTGAIGLVQFEPSAFSVAVDGDGDGKIDLFDPEDAILSVAHYLVTRGWDNNPEHQKRAVYAYYGGHYNTDPYKYYMKAVLKYADTVRASLKDNPLGSAIVMVGYSLSLPGPELLQAVARPLMNPPFDLPQTPQ
jgi:membrane-bound lytic murein transglycosylase B